VRDEGELHDGKLIGRVVITWSNGNRYDGGYEVNRLSGRGVFTSANGDRYEGEFRDGRRDGRGVLTLSNGTRYDGEFRDGKRNGRGVGTSAQGERQDGLWRDDKYIGPFGVTQARGSARDEIPLLKSGGTVLVPVMINGAITLKFMIDSGASDVSIPADVVLTLMLTGTINDTGFLEKRNYRLADGRIVPSQVFRIKSLKVGSKVLENVTGSVAPAASTLLLGQTFLSRFKSWSIDNQRQVLILE
jgi:clan AA aspartic protease (TIGR02281 family)